ncbi:MAG: response regulator [Acidobacteria bacterium]|nr:response regulator [Acidobacteriota bacterium]
MMRTILIADDEQANRKLLEELLRGEGYQVAAAVDGQRALEEFGRLQPDLVLLDVMMPHLDGWEVCRRLKGNPETRLTPVVLVTGLSATEDRIRGIEAGADDFLTKPFDRSELLARVHSLLSLKAYTDELERAESVLFALARSVEARDPCTGDHCERLSEYSVRLGEHIGLPEEQITALRRAGIVHDLGKVMVPDAILLKPGGLTAEEWEIMRTHPVAGERICAPLKSFGLVLPIIRHHHEKFDGSGYPDGLQGEQISLTARVFQIADVYDALTTPRPYKRALSTPEALKTMQDEVDKGWWDPRVFAEFRQMVVRAGAGPLQPHRKSVEEVPSDFADRATQMQSRSAASIRHELRRPLTAIIGFADLLAQGTAGSLNEKQRRYLEHVLNGARRLVQLIDDLPDPSEIGEHPQSTVRSARKRQRVGRAREIPRRTGRGNSNVGARRRPTAIGSQQVPNRRAPKTRARRTL